MGLIQQLNKNIINRTRLLLLDSVDFFEFEEVLQHTFSEVNYFLDIFTSRDARGKLKFEEDLMSILTSKYKGREMMVEVHSKVETLANKIAKSGSKAIENIFAIMLLLNYSVWKSKDSSTTKSLRGIIHKLSDGFAKKHVMMVLERMGSWMFENVSKVIMLAVRRAMRNDKLDITHRDHDGSVGIIRILSLLFESNSRRRRVDPESLVIRKTNGLRASVEYIMWQNIPNQKFIDFNQTICLYPDVLPFQFKRDVLNYELAQIRAVHLEELMYLARKTGFFNIFRINFSNRFIIDREHLLSSTIKEFEHLHNFRLTSSVKFMNEDGCDVGGLFREWVGTVSRCIVNDERLFQYDAELGTYWPSPAPHSPRDLHLFEVFGKVMGLALYNNMVPLGVDFPVVFFEKLTAPANQLQEVTMDIYERVDTVSACHLNKLRTCDDPFEIIDDSTPEDDRSEKTLEAYIHNFMDTMLNERVKEPFCRISKGFYMICPANSLKLLNFQELQTLISGNHLSDDGLVQLSKHTIYENCKISTPIIVWFWDLVHKMETSQQEKLLHFITGSRRLPTHSTPAIKITLANYSHPSNPPEVKDIYLPKAHTCSRQLCLDAEIMSQSVLEEKLNTAIDLCEIGFALQ